VSRPLRIFLSCQQAHRRHPVPAYDFWVEYFRHGLAEAGHECVESPGCDWAEGLLPLDPATRAAWLERTWNAALDDLRREHRRRPVDLFLSYLYPQQVSAGALAAIRDLGIPRVNFFCDNVREFRRVPAEFAPFDLHWVPEFKATALYQQAGLPWLNAPMPCWVPPAQRVPVARENDAITFVGTRDEQRAVLFAAAIPLGLPVELRGVGWSAPAAAPAAPPAPRLGFAELAARQVRFARQHGWGAVLRKFRPAPPVAFDFSAHVRPAPDATAYWEVLRESRVFLGVNRYPSPRHPFRRPDSYSRLRDIEAPMAGACYLTEWTEGIDALYEPGVEIATYRTPAELVEQARALAADAPRRTALRTAGQRRALHDHSIARTLERIRVRLSLPA
jgi:hypothetical protein